MPDSTACAEPTKRGRFAIVPQWIYTSVTDAVTLRVYIHLAGEHQSTTPTPDDATLAAELGYPEQAIKKALRHLCHLGAIAPLVGVYILPLDDPHDPDLHT